MARQEFTQQRTQEDPQIKTLRQENPDRYEVLEKRTRTRATSTLVSPKFSPASPTATLESPKFSPASPTATLESPKFSPASPTGTLVSPKFSPASPTATLVSPKFSPASPTATLVSPKFSPASPTATLVLPKFSPASPTATLVAPEYSPVSPGYCSEWPGLNQFFPTPEPASESAQYLLKNELGALLEVVNSVRVDLLQTSMLVNYISEYIKRNWK